PGRHSRPDDERDEQRRGVSPAPSIGVLPAAGDTVGPGAGSTTASPRSEAHSAYEPTQLHGAHERVEPAGAHERTEPAADDRDYLAELTAGLAKVLGDEHDAAPNGDGREGDAGRGAGTTAKDAGEEGRP
ncbi:MAG TPA: hypothetical protein VNN79_25100, partial [Actinomycetota bacterium]|nr:hypothetical protein [Actinomycetota bacterium]